MTTELRITKLMQASRETLAKIDLLLDGKQLGTTELVPVVKRSEAARLLGVSVKRIDQLSQMNAIKRITPKGSSRAIGYTATSIRELIEARQESEVA